MRAGKAVAVTMLLARFDDTSQGVLRQFFRKVTLFAVFATMASLPQVYQLAMIGRLLQVQCLVAGGFSIFLATLLRQKFDAPTLTYWDEALAFAGIGMLSHLVTGLAQPPV